MRPHLLIFTGSLRANSVSRALTAALARRLEAHAEFGFADIGTLPLYNADIADDPAVATLVGQVRQADGVLFVTPEYNYSIPGVLKNAIDWASRPAYQSAFLNKDCFVISLSGGAMGGVRAQAHLKYILNGMVARIFPAQEVVVPFGNDKVENGRFHHEPTLDFATAKVREFLDSLKLHRSEFGEAPERSTPSIQTVR